MQSHNVLAGCGLNTHRPSRQIRLRIVKCLSAGRGVLSIALALSSLIRFPLLGYFSCPKSPPSHAYCTGIHSRYKHGHITSNFTTDLEHLLPSLLRPISITRRLIPTCPLRPNCCIYNCPNHLSLWHWKSNLWLKRCVLLTAHACPPHWPLQTDIEHVPIYRSVSNTITINLMRLHARPLGQNGAWNFSSNCRTMAIPLAGCFEQYNSSKSHH